MYEELIRRLKESDFERLDCTPFECGAFSLLAEAGTALAALQSENGEKDREIERLIKKATLNAFIKYVMKRACEELIDTEAALSRVEAERDAAMAEIPHECRTCKHKPQKYGVCGMGCEVGPVTINHAERCHWEWCGAQGEG